MIGSLMYLIASRPDIMFAVCAYAGHQVTPKECHLHAVKRIFRYLKGHPKLGLWYPKESPFDLVAYSDSDYGGATQDCKSTTGGIYSKCLDDDDDYNFAITPDEPVDSLGMGDEHLNTIPATESDEFIKYSVENLVPNPKKIFLNPLFEEEIIPMKIEQHHDNAESDLTDSLLDEFTGELTLLKSISSGIDETDCDPEEDIHLIERLLYDNSSPRPPEEFVSENSNADIESFSPSPIPVEDSDSLMEEIDLSFNPDDPMPPGIEEDDDDSERDILIREELLDNYSLSLPVIESYHFDIPSFSRPPAKPPYGNTGILNIKMMGDISDQKIHMTYDHPCFKSGEIS
nr:putative ribonuclease H-like domain-containing protein [Tanacetum cinerariifolium]